MCEPGLFADDDARAQEKAVEGTSVSAALIKKKRHYRQVRGLCAMPVWCLVVLQPSHVCFPAPARST
jgi:hypothetical protein